MRNQLIYVSSFYFAFLQCQYVQAGIFIKEKNPIIIQDAIWLYSNSSSISSIAPDVSPNEFVNNIMPLRKLPLANKDGTMGLLYHKQDVCNPSHSFHSITKNKGVPKIAFIHTKNDSCSLHQKIWTAEIEGAIGVILYDLSLTDANLLLDRFEKEEPLENKINIPAYYADRKVGQELIYQLEKMAGVPVTNVYVNGTDTNLTARISVRIQLFPADHLTPAAWELTLMIMIVILGTSILFSGIMHLYLWKKGKKLLHSVERRRQPQSSRLALPMGKPLLAQAKLQRFPKRIVNTLPDEEEVKKVVLALESKDHTPNQSNGLFKKITNIFNNKTVPTPDPISTPIGTMCVVCLEAFKIGDQVRELPCRHDYHCDCIDPWLTTKSGECPLCKFDCSIEDEIPSDRQDGTIATRYIRNLLTDKRNKPRKPDSILPTTHPTVLQPPVQTVSPNVVVSESSLAEPPAVCRPVSFLADLSSDRSRRNSHLTSTHVSSSEGSVEERPRYLDISSFSLFDFNSINRNL